MSFSDSDWTRDPPPRPAVTPAQRRVLTLAIAVAAAGLAVALALYGIDQWIESNPRGAAWPQISDPIATAPAAASAAQAPTEQAPTEPAPTSQSAAATPATSASAASVKADGDIDRQQLDALEAEMKQRAKEAAEQAAVDAARRKERAWERWYQRPAFCGENPTSAQMIECANHHIRARRQFEERWAAGRL